jgi:hypothetical protein
MAPPIGKKQVKLNAALLAMMLQELVAGPCTGPQLAEHTGMSTITVYHTLRALHRKHLVHIAAWDTDTQGRKSVRAFAFGEGKDVPRPRAKRARVSKSEYDNRVRARKLGGTMYAGLML